MLVLPHFVFALVAIKFHISRKGVREPKQGNDDEGVKSAAKSNKKNTAIIILRVEYSHRTTTCIRNSRHRIEMAFSISHKIPPKKVHINYFVTKMSEALGRRS